MTKRFLLTFTLAVASAFALTVAAPVYACGKDCDCAKKAPADKKPEAKPGAKPDAKPAEKAAADKKAEAGKCECTKDGKGCTCKKGECKCPNCGQAPKFAAGEEKKGCECTKGKDCTCPKGGCKCAKKAV